MQSPDPPRGRRARGERRFRATFDLAAVGFARVAIDGRIILANPRLEQILGYGPGELVGRHVADVSHPDDRDATRKVRAKLHAGEIPLFRSEKRYLRKDGSTAWVGITASVMRDAQGNVLHDVSAVEDIGVRKRAEAELRKSEARFRSLLELSFDVYRRRARQPSGRRCGNRMTSRIDGLSVSNMTSRSTPMPQPAVGGRPCSSARM